MQVLRFSMAATFSVVLFLIFVVGLTVAGQQRSDGSRTGLQGAWRMVELTTTGPDASTNPKPQPILLMFSGRHYSAIFLDSDKPRPDPTFLRTSPRPVPPSCLQCMDLH